MLNQLKSPKTKSSKKRVGRGYGSGKGGHTVGRGQKGQKSRAGYSSPRPGFEGGAMPLSRRIPKYRGFSRGFAQTGEVRVEVQLEDLNTLKSGDTVSEETLRKAGLVTTKSKSIVIKILGKGELKKKLTIESGIQMSASARKAIEAAEGTIK